MKKKYIKPNSKVSLFSVDVPFLDGSEYSRQEDDMSKGTGGGIDWDAFDDMEFENK